MKNVSRTAASLLASLAFACSSTEVKTSSPGTPGPSSTTETPAPPSDPVGTNDPPAAAAPKAPTVDTVAKMMGALHVMWTNNDTTCDTVEVERQAQMADGSVMEKYTVVYSLPGEADNKHDTDATDDMTYSYRLRCKKGATYSAYSNEMSGNPKQ